MRVLEFVDADSLTPVCPHCHVADRFWTRLRGLLGRSELGAGEGMLIRPTWSVHTAFMRFPIDVAFLDGDLRVLKISENLQPWRAASRLGSKAVLELAGGECRRRSIVAGSRLAVRK